MRRRIGNILIAILLLLSVMAAGCGKVTTTQAAPYLSAAEAVKDSIAQVWVKYASADTATFEALGILVGDGTTVLTVIDYEDFTPGEAEVRTQDNRTFSATIQAIDARTAQLC